MALISSRHHGDGCTHGAVSLADLDGTNGFRLDGIAAGDQSGYSVSGAGDINGDGFADIVVGAPWAERDGNEAIGEAYVVFGSDAGYPSSLDLSALDGTNGFRLAGVAASDLTGFSVAGAGDVNGDGVDDLILGAPGFYTDGTPSASYVVFGTTAGFAPTFDLASLDGSNGFRIDIDVGGWPYNSVGYSVDGAGDINGDGIDDLIVGNPDYFGEGPSYVVFGSADGFDASFDLATLDGTDGFRLDGGAHAVAGAGDVNGDGIDDLIVGLFIRDNYATGESYVVFGTDSGFPADLDLADLDGTNGFRINAVGDYGGNDILSVAAAGDVNGDGIDDVIVASPSIPESYVVFGTDKGFAPSLDLAALDGANGFRMGLETDDHIAFTVAGAGDFNGDGIDDLIIGAASSAPYYYPTTGTTYVVFGTDAGFPADLDLATLDGTNGLRLDGVGAEDESGWSVAGAGDVNADGFDDLVVGAPGANGGAGESYIVFGFDSHAPLKPIFGHPGRDVLVGTDRDESFHPGGGRDLVTTGGGDDTIYFDDRAGKRDVLVITDFDLDSDTLDLRGAAVTHSFECKAATVLFLDGPDCDAVVLLGLDASPVDLI